MPEPRFTVSLILGGYEVTDSDGRPVSRSYDSLREASETAEHLNAAADNGPRSLRLALGALYAEDELEIEAFENELDEAALVYDRLMAH